MQMITMECILKEVMWMPKDSQPDNKKSRKLKANGNTPLTEENQNQNRTSKKHSTKNNDV